MTVRLVCEHCANELELARIAPGRIVLCPQCGEALSPAASMRPFPGGKTNDPFRNAAPTDRDPGDGIPWYVWLGAFVPASMLAFVAFEPIAIGVAVGLVAIGLIAATRSHWSQLSRVTGIASLTLLGYAAAIAVNLSSQGSFAKFDFAKLLSREGANSKLADAAWNEIITPDDVASVLVPGVMVKSELDEPTGANVAVYQSKYPKQGVTFALYTFRLAAAQMNEAGELSNFERAHEICEWIFFDAAPDQFKRIFYYGHPGFEGQLTVMGKRTTIVCRAYVIRDKAFVLAATAESLPAVKPFVDRFLSSFQLIKPLPSMQSPRTDPEPDWEAMGRPPLPKPMPYGSFRGHLHAPVIVLAFSEDGSRLVTGSGREHLVLWDLATGHGSVAANVEGYGFFAVSPSGKYLALPIPKSLATSALVRFLDLRDAVPKLGQAATDRVSFARDNTTTLVALDDLETAWDAADGLALWERKTANVRIVCQVLSPDGRTLAIASEKETIIRLWNVANKGADVASWSAHVMADKVNEPIQQLAFSPDGKILASAGVDNSVKLWSLANLNAPKLAAIMLHDEPVSCVEYSNNGKLIATGDSAGIVRIWQTSTGKLLKEFRACEMDRPVQMLRFSPDDLKLAAAVEMGIGRAGANVYVLATIPREQGSSCVTFQVTDEPPLLTK